MSKQYLKKTVSSVIRDGSPQKTEEMLREQINNNLDDIKDTTRIRNNLRMEDVSRSHRLLYASILSTLLESPGLVCNEKDLYDRIKAYEKKVIDESKREDALAYLDEHTVDIFKTVLGVALEDNDINNREFILLQKLRKKLELTLWEQRIMEAQLNMYPKPGNEYHTWDEFKKVHNDLQNKGILFYCNKADDGPLIVLTAEMKSIVKEILEIELREAAYQDLLNHLFSTQLGEILKNSDHACSGSKEARIERIMRAGVKPSEALNTLSLGEIKILCRRMKGLKISGTKEELTWRIIDYFSSLSNKQPEESEDQRAVFYQYFEELAARNNKELLGKRVITKDVNMERYFELATHYLFEEKLGLKPVDQKGTEKADGCIEIGKEDVLLWDNKSKEDNYEFPQSHLKQFQRYIRESTSKVKTFLVIVSELDKNKVSDQTFKLKLETPDDTDIAVIRARDLKYVAENWRKFASENRDTFDPRVFNATGVLSRQQLEKYMKLVL